MMPSLLLTCLLMHLRFALKSMRENVVTRNLDEFYSSHFSMHRGRVDGASGRNSG